MAAHANSTVLPFPTNRKRPYPNPRYLQARDFPENVVRLEPALVWVQVQPMMAQLLREGGHA